MFPNLYFALEFASPTKTQVIYEYLRESYIHLVFLAQDEVLMVFQGVLFVVE